MNQRTWHIAAEGNATIQFAAEEFIRLMKKLDLPEHMSANALLQAVNLLYTLDELRALIQQLGENHD